MPEKYELLSEEDADQEIPDGMRSETVGTNSSWLTRRKVFYFVLLMILLAISTAMSVFHCAYIWRLLVLSVTEARPFDSLSSSEDLTGHCGAILLHGLPWTKDFVGNESTLGPDFPSCG